MECEMSDTNNTQIIENWKPIKGFEDLYLVSDMGNIYSIRNKKNLVPKKGTNDYIHVALCRGKKKYVNIHRLVAREFLGLGDSDNRDVNHIDGDHKNNKLSNLELVSRRENCSHYTLRTKNSVGISYCKPRKCWRAFIRVNKKQIYLGGFPTKEEAQNIYLKALSEYNIKDRYAESASSPTR